MTGKKCEFMGVTRDLAPVLIRQFLHSYWSRATAETVVPHYAIRATRTAFPYKEYTVLTHIRVWVKPKLIFFIPDANLTSIIGVVYPRAAKGFTIS